MPDRLTQLVGWLDGDWIYGYGDEMYGWLLLYGEIEQRKEVGENGEVGEFEIAEDAIEESVHVPVESRFAIHEEI